MTRANEEFDLVVAGGGPAGSTIATLVAMSGHRVLLLERERFPRYQIGESLLPSTIHGVCPLLGVSEEIHKANFVRKAGGTFRWGKGEDPWTFSFADSPHTAGPTCFAYQVERSKFDAILLDNARRKGVEVREHVRITGVNVEGGRVVGANWRDEQGTSHSTSAKYVADASGNESLIARNVGERVYSDFFQNIALYGYYRNGKRLPPPNNGNILCAAFDGGWFWYIPLGDSLTSVGAVVSRSHLPLLQQGHAQAMDKFIASCPLIQQYLSQAERITDGQYGKLRVRKDYSYTSTKFWSPGMVTIGDAACFIDPVFSSGVHLATYAGLLAARSINSCLEVGMDESRAFAEFEMRYRREFANFYKFLIAFYDMNQDLHSYFWTARKLLNSSQSAHESFVTLVAGLSSSAETNGGVTQEFLTTTQSLSNSMKRAQSAPGEFAVSAVDSAFMNALTKESSQLQFRSLSDSAAPEVPLWNTGLVPTEDGKRWREVMPAS
jgi:FAD-dependent halogenase